MVMTAVGSSWSSRAIMQQSGTRLGVDYHGRHTAATVTNSRGCGPDKVSRVSRTDSDHDKMLIVLHLNSLQRYSKSTKREPFLND